MRIFRFKIYFPETPEQFIIVELDQPDYCDGDDSPEDIATWLWEDMTGYLTYDCEIVERIMK